MVLPGTSEPAEASLRLRGPSLICRTWPGSQIYVRLRRAEKETFKLCHHTWWPRCRLLGVLFASTSNVFPGVNTRGRHTEAVLSPSHVQRRGPSCREAVSSQPSRTPFALSYLSLGVERLLLIVARTGSAAFTRARARATQAR